MLQGSSLHSDTGTPGGHWSGSAVLAGGSVSLGLGELLGSGTVGKT